MDLQNLQKWSVHGLLILLQCWEIGRYMAPLSVNLTPLGLWSIKKWIRLARRYVIAQHKTLVPMVTLGMAHST
jgi:hypothetical protein